MGLNIKNDHVHALAREAARRTGQSQTSVIQSALEQLLLTLDQNAAGGAPDRISHILRDFDTTLTAEDRAAMTTDELYDELGLPR